MEVEDLREIVSNNRELEEQLTKKNAQYIFDLKKSLKVANFSEEEQALALHELLPVLVIEQKRGATARQLFGTVSERVDAILNKPKTKPKATPALMWLDNALLLMGALSIMSGIMSLFSKGKSQSMGILTLFFASMAGGFVVYLMYKYVYQYDRPDADKSQKPSWLKTASVLVGSILLWFLVFAGSSMLPSVINPILDPFVVVVMGALTLVLRYFLKKKYNMQSSFSAQQ